MEFRLALARFIAATATLALVPTVVAARQSRIFLDVAVIETAVLAIAAGYAVFVGIYRYPR